MSELFIYPSKINDYSIPAKFNVTSTLPIGKGAIPDVTSATIEKGENLSFELKFTFYATNKANASQYVKVGAIVGAPVNIGHDSSVNNNSNYDFFKIYKIEKSIDNKCTVYAEHYSYILNNIFFKPMGSLSISDTATLMNYLCGSNFVYSKGLDRDNFTVVREGRAEVKLDITKVQEQVPVSARNVLNSLKDSSGNSLSGKFQLYAFRDAIWYKKPEVKDRVYYGTNLLSATVTDDSTDTVNAILPYWQDSDDNTICVYGDVCYYRNSQYLPYSQAKVMSFKDNYKTKPTADQLNASAYTYLQNHTAELGNQGCILEKLEANYVPNDKVEVGDLIEVYLPDKDKMTAVITGYTYDCLKNVFTKVKLENSTAIY